MYVTSMDRQAARKNLVVISSGQLACNGRHTDIGILFEKDSTFHKAISIYNNNDLFEMFNNR